MKPALPPPLDPEVEAFIAATKIRGGTARIPTTKAAAALIRMAEPFAPTVLHVELFVGAGETTGVIREWPLVQIVLIGNLTEADLTLCRTRSDLVLVELVGTAPSDLHRSTLRLLWSDLWRPRVAPYLAVWAIAASIVTVRAGADDEVYRGVTEAAGSSLNIAAIFLAVYTVYQGMFVELVGADIHPGDTHAGRAWRDDRVLLSWAIFSVASAGLAVLLAPVGVWPDAHAAIGRLLAAATVRSLVMSAALFSMLALVPPMVDMVGFLAARHHNAMMRRAAGQRHSELVDRFLQARTPKAPPSA